MAVLIDLACDGSGTANGSPGGWAFVLRATETETGEILREREGFGGAVSTSSQKMELTACIMGLRALRRPSPVTVISDSEYMLNGHRQKWVEKWAAKGWKKVANVELWQALVKEADKHDIEWTWTRGHSGHALNERCDELAGDCRRAVKLALEADAVSGLDFPVLAEGVLP